MSTTLTPEQLAEALSSRGPRLRAMIESRMPDRFRTSLDVDDILQHVWIAALRGLGSVSFDEPGSLDGWLRTVTRNELFQAVRRLRRIKRGGEGLVADSKREPARLAFYVLASVADPDVRTPSREFARRESRQLLDAALAVLTKQNQDAVRMRYLEGRSLADIGRELGKSKAAVNSMLNRSRSELRVLLGHARRFFSDG